MEDEEGSALKDAEKEASNGEEGSEDPEDEDIEAAGEEEPRILR